MAALRLSTVADEPFAESHGLLMQPGAHVV
jgi:hypothetical protein